MNEAVLRDEEYSLHVQNGDYKHEVRQCFRDLKQKVRERGLQEQRVVTYGSAGALRASFCRGQDLEGDQDGIVKFDGMNRVKTGKMVIGER